MTPNAALSRSCSVVSSTPSRLLLDSDEDDEDDEDEDDEDKDDGDTNGQDEDVVNDDTSAFSWFSFTSTCIVNTFWSCLYL